MIAHDDTRNCKCGEPEDGYALKDEDGKYYPACWSCVQKRIKKDKKTEE